MQFLIDHIVRHNMRYNLKCTEICLTGDTVVFHGRHIRWILPLVTGVLLLTLDQLSKYWVVQTLGPVPLTESIPLVGDWFRLVYSHNTGVAFSLFQGFPQILTIVALSITVGIIYAYIFHLPNRNRLIQLSAGLIVGGALGNIVDRIRLGYVVDFIQVGWWPVFNVADSAVCVGAALLLLELMRTDAVQKRQRQITAS